MKYIEKGKSPDFFDKWKLGKSPKLWSDLKNPEKKKLRIALLEEQGYICCYCNQRINNDPLHTKIEHFYPKDANKYPEKMFDYENLLIACNGGERDAKPITLHCDSKKDNKEPAPISPKQKDCAICFKYFSNGKMEGKSDKAIQTINDLGLDIKKLRILRKKSIDEFLEIYSEDETDDLLEDLNEKDLNGKYIPFCKAIEFVLVGN